MTGGSAQDPFRARHEERLAWMPWLYARLKPAQRAWAEPWQQGLQAELEALETVRFGTGCFVAPTARIFAEPGRAVEIGDRSTIAAACVLHGPIALGSDVSLNHHVTVDGGRRGVHIGAGTRIAAYCTLFAFDHGVAPERPVREQPVTSEGIVIGADVWLGARVGVVDGVHIGDGAVIGMSAQVTRDVPAGAIAAGNPARVIGWREGTGEGA